MNIILNLNFEKNNNNNKVLSYLTQNICQTTSPVTLQYPDLYPYLPVEELASRQ